MPTAIPPQPAVSLRYPPRLSLARLPTPLQPLDRLRALGGGPRIWVKRDDLSDCAVSGNKVRKLEFTLAQALAEGADTLISCGGLQSNHCRATALLGARLGLQVHLVLRGEAQGTPDGNLFLDHLAGAQVHCYPAARYLSERDSLLRELAARLRTAGRRPFVIPTGASDEIGVWGYVAASAELAMDFASAGIEPRHVVVATGSGGTQAGLSAGLHLYAQRCEVLGIAVCDDAAWFHNKVNCDLADWKRRYRVAIELDRLRIRVLDDYIGAGYARADAAVFATIAQAARLEGLVLDPVYTGKAFHGMLEEIRAGRLCEAEDIVFVHTGGIFGLFAQRAEAMREIAPGAAG
ncbi:MAG: D-cysteine desulfhydrase family protein [Gammaproteobacteria bacterium]|nr:D-cysteine desulfhydrase family protein [Gammaproteobacteria bacterium]MBK6582316.1 D-cysteine desulfhydrase family protein [Gammaproteobacteria bacterium]MBK7171423.1 D-cysteine desulfhydrase family protein [Gammaproteobacteria bacterium]MBK7521411.1 D-cysteine desulfhydrase family protein [Gammaproteobacteria bacterium]MBK7729189.1 D-cysteine desulfhydrase family protein [Gammaproteobacteria bacterium]